MADKSPYHDIKMLLASAGSRFFTVKFVKADTSIREMTVQLAAGKKHLTPTEEHAPGMAEAIKRRKENNPHLYNVWDIHKNEWRCINMNTLLEVHLNGKKYRIENFKPVLIKD